MPCPPGLCSYLGETKRTAGSETDFWEVVAKLFKKVCEARRRLLQRGKQAEESQARQQQQAAERRGATALLYKLPESVAQPAPADSCVDGDARRAGEKDSEHVRWHARGRGAAEMLRAAARKAAALTAKTPFAAGWQHHHGAAAAAAAAGTAAPHC